MSNLMIAMLLWLGCIIPGTWYLTQLNSYASANQTQINAALSSQTQTNLIWNTYGVLVPDVEVLDDDDN